MNWMHLFHIPAKIQQNVTKAPGGGEYPSLLSSLPGVTPTDYNADVQNPWDALWDTAWTFHFILGSFGRYLDFLWSIVCGACFGSRPFSPMFSKVLQAK